MASTMQAVCGDGNQPLQVAGPVSRMVAHMKEKTMIAKLSLAAMALLAFGAVADAGCPFCP